MVNVDYYKQLVQDNPIESDAIVITYAAAGITVSMVPCRIERWVSLKDFKSCRVRFVVSHNKLKFTCLDSLEYLKLRDVVNEFENHEKNFGRARSPSPSFRK